MTFYELESSRGGIEIPPQCQDACHWLLLFSGKTVTNAVYGLDICRGLWRGLDFLTYAPNVNVDAAGCNTAIITPDPVQQLIARKNHEKTIFVFASDCDFRNVSGELCRPSCRKTKY